MRLHLLTLIFITFLFSSKAQNTIQYDPLKCQGEMPAFFRQTFIEKYELHKSEIRKSKVKNKKLEFKYAANQEYFFDNLITHGLILYGDPISDYLNTITKYILDQNKQITNDFKVYTLKNSYPTCFTDHKNNIYFSTALLSNVDNEAQLAFLICQQIAHSTLKHRYLNFYSDLETFSINNFEIVNNINLLYYNYDAYFESDLFAVDLLSHTEYDPKQAIDAVNIPTRENILLEFSSISSSIWNDEYLYLPSKYFTKELKDKNNKTDESQITEYFEKRSSKIENKIRDFESLGKKLYVQPETLFDDIQEQTRVELILNYLNDGYFIMAYLAAYQYQKLYEETIFTSKVMAYCMYQKSMYEQEYHNNTDTSIKRIINLGVLNFDPSSTALLSSGELYKMQYCFSKLDYKKSAILALKEAWKSVQNNPHDSFSNRLAYHTLLNLFNHKIIIKQYTFFDRFQYEIQDSILLNKLQYRDENTNKINHTDITIQDTFFDQAQYEIQDSNTFKKNSKNINENSNELNPFKRTRQHTFFDQSQYEIQNSNRIHNSSNYRTKSLNNFSSFEINRQHSLIDFIFGFGFYDSFKNQFYYTLDYIDSTGFEDLFNDSIFNNTFYKIKSKYYEKNNYRRPLYGNDSYKNTITKDVTESTLISEFDKYSDTKFNIIAAHLDSICIISPAYNAMKLTEHNAVFNLNKNESYNKDSSDELSIALPNDRVKIVYINNSDRSNFNTVNYNLLMSMNNLKAERINNYARHLTFNSQFMTSLPQFKYVSFLAFYNIKLNNQFVSQYSINFIELNKGTSHINVDRYEESKYQHGYAISYLRKWFE